MQPSFFVLLLIIYAFFSCVIFRNFCMRGLDKQQSKVISKFAGILVKAIQVWFDRILLKYELSNGRTLYIIFHNNLLRNATLSLTTVKAGRIFDSIYISIVYRMQTLMFIAAVLSHNLKVSLSECPHLHKWIYLKCV